MKKLLIVLLILFITTFSAAFFFAVPYGFHTVIHKMIIQEIDDLDGKVNYEVITRDHHQSTFRIESEKMREDYKVEVASLTFLNPLENHVKVTITNTRNIEQNFEYFLYFELVDGKLRLKLNSKDIKFQKDQMAIELKGVNLYFGDFSTEDFREKPEDLFDVIYNKKIKLEISQVQSELNGNSTLIKGLELTFSNEMNENQLEIQSSMNFDEANTIINNKPVFYKKSKGDFHFGTLHADKTKEFVSTMIENENPMMKNPMFLAMSAMNILKFPIKVQVDSSGESDDGMMLLNAKAQMKTKNFMDLSNFNIEVFAKNNEQYVKNFIVPSIANRFAEMQAPLYATNQEPKNIQAAFKVIEELLVQEFIERPEDLFKVLLDLKMLKQEDKLYVFNFKLENGKVTLDDELMELSEFFDLPQLIVNKFFQDPKDSNINTLEAKLKELGLTKNNAN